MVRNIFVIGGALLAGCLAGVWLGFSEADSSASGKISAPPGGTEATEITEWTPVSSPVSTGASSDGISGALAEILSDKLESRLWVALGRFCDGLDTEGIRTAMNLYREDYSDNGWEVRHRLMGRWAELDPAGAASYSLTTVDSRLRKGFLYRVLEVWAHTDPEAAKRFVLEMESGSSQSSIISSFGGILSERDPEAALRFAEAVPAADKERFIRLAFHHLAHANSAAALARASTLPDLRSRDKAINSVLAVWIEKEPQAALAWMERNPVAESKFDRRTEEMLTRLLDSDPGIATAYAEKLPEGEARRDMIPNLAWHWACDDPFAALSWVHKLDDGPEKAGALRRVISALGSREPESAAVLILQQPHGENMGEMLQDLGTTWTRSDPEGAMKWALAHPSPEVEKHVLSIALGRLAADDPAKAVAGLEHLQSPEGKKEATMAIARKWIRRDPESAMEWLLSGSDSQAQSTAVSEWTNHDPAGLASWLNARPDHPHRESVLSTYISVLQYYAPEAAANWASTLKDAGSRKRLLSEAVERMARYDANAARRWLDSQGFGAAEQKALREQVDAAERNR